MKSFFKTYQSVFIALAVVTGLVYGACYAATLEACHAYKANGATAAYKKFCK